MRYLQVTTSLFYTDQPDERLDIWFAGADIAGWIYARLLPLKGIEDYCCPVMEDWGWTLAVDIDEIRVWFLIYDTTCKGYWSIGVEAKNRLLKRHSPEAIEQAQARAAKELMAIFADDPRIEKIAWSEEDDLFG